MASLSKADYLEKMYGSKGNEKKKKKKPKAKVLKNNIKIIDSDAKFVSNPADVDSEDEGKFDLQEEKPILFAKDGAQVINEEYKRKQDAMAAKWAPIKITGPEAPQKKPAKKRHDSSDDDLSPPRPTKQSKPARAKRQRHDSSDSDLSPDRGRQTISGGGGKGGSDSDLSPVRSRKPAKNSKDSDSDLSPQRNKKDTDLSPKRKGHNSSGGSRDTKPAVIHSVSKATGLQSAADIRKDNERRQLELAEKLKALDSEVSGRGAETVYRDKKSGKKVDLKYEEHLRRRAEEAKSLEMEKSLEWGKGVAQTNEYQQKLHDDALEADKPMARYKDDADLEDLLKNRDRAEDPMLAFMQKKRKTNGPQKPRYNGPAPPPNRFNIWPGYRWDGVDRTSGFEKKRFQKMSERKAFESAKYKWSTEAM